MWTARLRAFAVASFLVFVASAPMVTAQEAHTGARPEKEERTRYLTNADVVRMVKAGVEEDAIIASIQSSRCRFILTPEALLALNKD